MLLQQLINGLTLGAIYTLVALSYSFVMGILGVLNIANAELFMMGGYIGFYAVTKGVPVYLALPIAMGGAVALGAVVERVAYRPLRSAPPLMPLLSTLGFSIIFQNIATNVWGSDPLQLPESPLDTRFNLGGGISIGAAQVVILAASLVLVAAMAATVQKTWIGRGLRAVAEKRDVARMLGVRATWLTVAAFLISAALAGGGGLLIGLHYAALTPLIGIDAGLKAIAVMVVGGTNRIWGVLVAGPLLGIAEVLTIAYGGSSYRDFIIYGLMILVLLLRPQGILGGTSALDAKRV
jgi:branched-chain amino acid transport system permease protein